MVKVADASRNSPMKKRWNEAHFDDDIQSDDEFGDSPVTVASSLDAMERDVDLAPIKPLVVSAKASKPLARPPLQKANSWSSRPNRTIDDDEEEVMSPKRKSNPGALLKGLAGKKIKDVLAISDHVPRVLSRKKKAADPLAQSEHIPRQKIPVVFNKVGMIVKKSLKLPSKKDSKSDGTEISPVPEQGRFVPPAILEKSLSLGNLFPELEEDDWHTRGDSPEPAKPASTSALKPSGVHRRSTRIHRLKEEIRRPEPKISPKRSSVRSHPNGHRMERSLSLEDVKSSSSRRRKEASHRRSNLPAKGALTLSRGSSAESSKSSSSSSRRPKRRSRELSIDEDKVLIATIEEEANQSKDVSVAKSISSDITVKAGSLSQAAPTEQSLTLSAVFTASKTDVVQPTVKVSNTGSTAEAPPEKTVSSPPTKQVEKQTVTPRSSLKVPLVDLPAHLERSLSVGDMFVSPKSYLDDKEKPFDKNVPVSAPSNRRPKRVSRTLLAQLYDDSPKADPDEVTPKHTTSKRMPSKRVLSNMERSQSLGNIILESTSRRPRESRRRSDATERNNGLHSASQHGTPRVSRRSLQSRSSKIDYSATNADTEVALAGDNDCAKDNGGMNRASSFTDLPPQPQTRRHRSSLRKSGSRTGMGEKRSSRNSLSSQGHSPVPETRRPSRSQSAISCQDMNGAQPATENWNFQWDLSALEGDTKDSQNRANRFKKVISSMKDTLATSLHVAPQKAHANMYASSTNVFLGEDSYQDDFDLENAEKGPCMMSQTMAPSDMIPPTMVAPIIAAPALIPDAAATTSETKVKPSTKRCTDIDLLVTGGHRRKSSGLRHSTSRGDCRKSAQGRALLTSKRNSTGALGPLEGQSERRPGSWRDLYDKTGTPGQPSLSQRTSFSKNSMKRSSTGSTISKQIIDETEASSGSSELGLRRSRLSKSDLRQSTE